MNIQQYISTKKENQTQLIYFLESEDEEDDYFTLDFFSKDKLIEDNIEFKLFLRLISKISKNHHRNKYFIQKIDKLILNFKQKIIETFTNLEIYDIFKGDKRILYTLLENKILTTDQTIIDNLFQKYNDFEDNSILYFIPLITDGLNNQKKSFYEFNISKLEYSISDLEKLCKIGENNSKIACLIRSDSVEDFISFVNANKISLSSHIQQSIFETNSLLIKNNPSLIEYATFFGSYQIVQYLKLSGVELTSSLWIYAIHSNNPDMIHLLEYEHIVPDDDSFKDCLKEAIKCHHNEIAEYIKLNMLSKANTSIDLKSNFWKNIVLYCYKYINYANMNFDMKNDIFFYGACKYNYVNIVELLLKEKKFDLNIEVEVDVFKTFSIIFAFNFFNVIS